MYFHFWVWGWCTFILYIYYTTCIVYSIVLYYIVLYCISAIAFYFVVCINCIELCSLTLLLIELFYVLLHIWVNIHIFSINFYLYFSIIYHFLLCFCRSSYLIILVPCIHTRIVSVEQEANIIVKISYYETIFEHSNFNSKSRFLKIKSGSIVFKNYNLRLSVVIVQ
jgi:hypothetical protein